MRVSLKLCGVRSHISFQRAALKEVRLLLSSEQLG
jgi:hypothetical protein